MAISAANALNELLAGVYPINSFIKSATPTLVAGRPHSLWYLNGNPGAGGTASTLAGTALSSSSSLVAGQIPLTDPVSNNQYLAKFQGAATIAGTLILADRLWSNNGFTITSTSPQIVNSVAWPARDNNGSTNGEGIIIGCEVNTATGAGTPTLTMGYTSSDNTSGRTSTNIIATVASSAIGAFYPIGLQAGDKGVRSIQNLTLSATWTSGAISLVAYRVLAALELTSAQTGFALDALQLGVPRLFNGTVPFLIFIPSTTTASVISGHIITSNA